MALTKVTGQVINSTTDLSVGVATVGGGTSTGDLYVVGVSTLVGDLSLNGNVTIGGTLTYEDVTNIDAVGLITARSGISVTGVGVTIALGGLNVNAGISSFNDNVLIGGPTHSRELSVHSATNTSICIEGAANGTSNLMFGDENDEDVGMIQYNHVDNDLAFTVNTGEALAIKSDGQLVASGTGAELNLTNSGSTATETTGYFYTSVSGIHNQLTIKTSTNNGGDPYIKFDGGGQDMIVGERYAGTTNNLLVLGPGNNPDTTSGIFVKGNGLVGVGTDNPQKDIHIESATPFLRLEETSSSAKRLDLWVESSDGYIGANQSSSDLHFQTTGSTRLTIKGNTGYTGIGTDDPQTILHVQSDAGDAMRLDRNNTGAVGNQIAFRHSNATGTLTETGSVNCVSTANAASGELRFYTKASGGSNSKRMTIASDGDVTIDSSSNAMQPGAAVNIVSDKNVESGVDDMDNYHLALKNPQNDTGEAIGLAFGITDTDSKVGAAILHERDASGSQGSLKFFTRPDNAGPPLEVMKITAGGKTWLKGSSGMPTGDSGAWLSVGSPTFSGTNFAHANTRLGIQNSGSLTCISNCSTYSDSTYPGYGFVLVQGPDTSTYNVMGICPDAPATGTDMNFHIGAQVTNIHSATNVRQVWFNASGNAYKRDNTTTWSTTSDERLKKNITDSPKGLAEINQLRVTNFEYRKQDEIDLSLFPEADNPRQVVIEGKEGIHTGLIAQEVENIFPECVDIRKKGAKSVNGDAITWAMVNAIKELSAENTALKARLDAAGL